MFPGRPRFKVGTVCCTHFIHEETLSTLNATKMNGMDAANPMLTERVQISSWVNARIWKGRVEARDVHIYFST